MSPANVPGQNLTRTGKAARRAYVKWREDLSPVSAGYAEAYWRHRRREAVSPPDFRRYGISSVQAELIEGAIESILRSRGVVVEKRASR